MLIFRRFNCICTASGTATLCERPYATMVKREFSLNQCNVQLLTESYGTSFVYVYVYVQHLVPSLSVSGCTLHWLRQNSPLTSIMYGRSQRVTVPDAVRIQNDVPSLSVSDHMLQWLKENSLLTSVTYGRSQRVTVPDAVHIQLNLLKMSIVMLETCRGL